MEKNKFTLRREGAKELFFFFVCFVGKNLQGGAEAQKNKFTPRREGAKELFFFFVCFVGKKFTGWRRDAEK